MSLCLVVFESPVWSGLLPLRAWTKTKTGPHKSQTGLQWSVSVFLQLQCSYKTGLHQSVTSPDWSFGCNISQFQYEIIVVTMIYSIESIHRGSFNNSGLG